MFCERILQLHSFYPVLNLHHVKKRCHFLEIHKKYSELRDLQQNLVILQISGFVPSHPMEREKMKESYE